jgi:DNA-binding PadR family transcriptional regulator
MLRRDLSLASGSSKSWDVISYKLSPGTLYPILHALERKGYLRSIGKREGRQARRMYRATLAGRKALAAAKIKVRELVGELFED